MYLNGQNNEAVPLRVVSSSDAQCSGHQQKDLLVGTVSPRVGQGGIWCFPFHVGFPGPTSDRKNGSSVSSDQILRIYNGEGLEFAEFMLNVVMLDRLIVGASLVLETSNQLGGGG